MKKSIIILVALLQYCFISAQLPPPTTTCSNTATTNNGNNVLQISKCYQTSNSPVKTGADFPYTISFSITGTVQNLIIEDILPTNLMYVSDNSPLWLNPPPILPISTNPDHLKWTNNSPVPAGAYSIDIIVKFKPGVTCNGEIALNSVSIEAKDIPKASTDPDSLSIVAEASDGWKIRKVRRKINYLIGSTFTTVTYDIYAYNSINTGEIGSHNLDNPSIIETLPPGATATFSCSLPTLDVMALNAGNPTSTPYHCTVEVKYPTSLFPVGSCPINKIELSGTNPCGETVTTTDTEEICIVDIIPPDPSGFLHKYVEITNKVPGCSGKYTMYFSNNGNTTISDFIFNDPFPINVNVNRIKISRIGSYGTVNFEYSSNLGATFQPFTTNYLDLNLNIPPLQGYKGIRIKPTTAITPNLNGRFKIEVYFSVKQGMSAPSIGTLVNNIATLDSNVNNIYKSKEVDFTIEPYQPKINIRKSICTPKPYVYRPGNKFIYRIALQNIGSEDYLGGILTDILDPRLEFQAGTLKTYRSNAPQSPYPSSCAGSNPMPPGYISIVLPPADITEPSSTNSNTLTINLPTIPQNCLAHNYPQPGYALYNEFETYFFEFEVEVKKGTATAIIPNKATVDNGPYDFTSNDRSVTITELFELSAVKEVSTDGGGTYSSIGGVVNPGATVRYKLEVTNTGNITFKNLVFIDGLPNKTADNSLQPTPCIIRGSTITTPLVMGSVNKSININDSYSVARLPDTNPEFGSSCGTSPPNWSSGASSATKSIKFENATSFSFAPLATEVVEFDVTIPPTAKSGDVICNDFTVRGISDNGTPSQLLSSNMVCVEIEEILPPDPCECITELGIFSEQGENLYAQQTTVNGVNASVASDYFMVAQNATIPITEVRASITDIQFNYNCDSCPTCVDNPALWGSMATNSTMIGNSPNVLNLETQPYSTGGLPSMVSNHENIRELIWTNPNGAMLTTGNAFDVQYLLPPISEMPCCVTSARVCVKISWKDANCNLCEEYVCSDISFEVQN